MRLRLSNPWLACLVGLLLVAALAYLPGIAERSYFRDDWYYIVDRTLGNAQTFQVMFHIDRPARGPFFEAAWRVLGHQPLHWHLASFFARLGGALAAWWLFQLVFPQRRPLAWAAAMLYLVYPGYRSWVAGVEFLPMVFSAGIHTLSICFSVLAVQPGRLERRLLWFGLALVTGLAALLLVDYAIGLEFFRLVCVALSMPAGRSFHSRLRNLLPVLLVPGSYLFWRLTQFTSLRGETNISEQLSHLVNSPLETIRWWTITSAESLVNQLFLAWAVPLQMNAFNIELSTIILCMLLALFAFLPTWLGLQALNRSGDDDPTTDLRPVAMSLPGVMVAIAPIILVHRLVEFRHYAHYSLPAALPTALLVAGVIFSLKPRKLANLALMALVALSVWSVTGREAYAREEETAINRLWHQVRWRTNGLAEETLLLVQYPGVDYEEDIDSAQGPAILLFSPQPQGGDTVVYPYGALPFQNAAGAFVQAGKGTTTGYRTHSALADPAHLLVITQPTRASCVHVQDGRWPRLSEADVALARFAAPYSRINELILTGEPPAYDPAVFGQEPAHGWCWYYQQAEKQVQLGDWQGVQDTLHQASAAGLEPSVPSEWLPFLQAKAVLGDEPGLHDLRARMNEKESLDTMICRTLHATSAAGHPLSPPAMELLSELSCPLR